MSTKFSLFMLSIALAVSAIAEPLVFPYDTQLTTRIATNGVVTVSGATVTLTGTVTPATDTVADLTATGVVFTAIDSEDWAEFVAGLNGLAMLTVKSTDSGSAWWGYTSSGWTALEGPAIDLTTNYNVQISFDKTTGNKIRYSVAKQGDPLQALTLEGNAWVPQGGSATQIAAVDFKGTGSLAAANLSSGQRAAYADVTGVDQTYSFDYSNVVFDVVIGEGGYGSNSRLRVTLTEGGVSKSVVQTITKGATNVVDFTGQGLLAGHTYDCKVEVLADDAPTSVIANVAQEIAMGTRADWFGFVNGGFTNATATGYVIEGGAFMAEDEELPVVVTPTSSSCSNSTSVVEINVDYTYFAVTSECHNAQSALCLTEDGWMGLASEGWVTLTNANIAIISAAYLTRAEFDYTVNPGKVRFSVKRDGEWYVMKHGSTEWFTLCGAERRLIGTSFLGSGKVSAIAASYAAINGVQPVVKDGVITLTGSTDADLSKLAVGEYTVKSAAGKNYNMKWSDKGSRYAKVENGKLVVKEGAPLNGLNSYQSFVLGLNADDAASRPVLDSAQNASADNLTFRVPNVKPNTDAAEVTMKVVELDSPSATTGTETVFGADGKATIALPDGVKYYKVKISIKTK